MTQNGFKKDLPALHPILISNRKIFLVQYGIYLRLWVFQKPETTFAKAARAISAFQWKIHSCKSIPNLTQNRMITHTYSFYHVFKLSIVYFDDRLHIWVTFAHWSRRIQMFCSCLSDRYSFRNSDFVIPRFNTVTYGKHSLRYLGPFLCSKLDQKVRNSESLNTFKAKIRKLDLVGLTEDNCKNCTLCSS